MLNRPIRCTLITLLAISISNCGGNSNLKPDASAPIVKSVGVIKNIPSQVNNTPNISITAKDLLNQAQQKSSPERENLQLQAAHIYLEQAKYDQTRKLLNELDAVTLVDATWISYSEISALLELKAGELELARRILTNPRLERHLNALEPQQEASLRTARAQVFERGGQLNDSVTERISLAAISTSTELTNSNQDALWQTLMSIPLVELQRSAAAGAGGVAQGWYSLAALTKNNAQNLEKQQADLKQWLSLWPNHPANGNLPKDLSLLTTLIHNQPQHIALILPLQGRLAQAGEAVLDGFFAAYYHALSEQSPSNTLPQMPSVRQYDTSKSATAAYQQAVADGADLIIGPLDKDDVNQLSHLTALPVPLLSLNYISTKDTAPPANFFQFGLAVEDEARQVARQGIRDGYKRALIVLLPQEWGERSVQAFSDEWQKLGGIIAGKSLFTTQDQFTLAIRDTMLIDASQARMTLLQQQLGTKLEFTPRHRADIDMVFMAATPVQGRQIKPTFVFHYASNIPIYATSNIYSGDIDATNNEDLNGVFFTTLPWLFDNNNPEKQVLAQTTKSSAVYSRLQALGADAFHVHARLSQLQQTPNMRLYGATGALHLLTDGRIEREQIWARFNAGLAEQITTIIANDDNQGGE